MHFRGINNIFTDSFIRLVLFIGLLKKGCILKSIAPYKSLYVQTMYSPSSPESNRLAEHVECVGVWLTPPPLLLLLPFGWYRWCDWIWPPLLILAFESGIIILPADWRLFAAMLVIVRPLLRLWWTARSRVDAGKCGVEVFCAGRAAALKCPLLLLCCAGRIISLFT